MSDRPCPQRGLDRIRPYVPGKPIDEVTVSYTHLTLPTN